MKEKSRIETQRASHSDLKDILPDLLTKQQTINSKRCNNMDGKVLRFYAILDDRDQLCDFPRKFIIHVIHIFHEIAFRILSSLFSFI